MVATSITTPILCRRPGGAHWRVVEIPPDSAAPADVDINDLIAEVNEKVPDWLAHGDISRPGMHRTPTIDFGVVLSGEIWLELEDGEVHLRAGDCVVQRGTMHAWRNRSDSPCVMSFVLIEASPKGSGQSTGVSTARTPNQVVEGSLKAYG